MKWSFFLFLTSVGWAVGQPLPPDQSRASSYQLVLEPLADPPIQPLPLGEPQTRTFGAGSSVDNQGNPCEVWSLQVDQPQTIRLTATSPDGDPLIRLWDSPKVFQSPPLSENDDMSGGSDSLLDFKLFPGQTYYVGVSVHFVGEATGSYTLTATPFTPPAPRPLPWGETVEGHLGAQSGSFQGKYGDVWTFSVQEPQTVLVALESTESAKLNVFVGPPEEGRTAQEDGALRRRQRIEARPGLAYHVLVQALEKEADYRLHLGPYTVPPLPSTIPLPATGTATGELTEEDPVFFDDPCDIWQIPGGNGQRLTLTCSSETIDPLLVLFDTPDFMMLPDDPHLLKAVASDDDGGGGTNARLSFDAEAGQNYYLLVLGYGLGNYQLQVESAPLPPLKNLPWGEAVTSTLSEGPEVWELVPAQAGMAIVQMKSEEFDAYVTARPGRSSSKNLAADDDSGGQLNATISFLVEANQTYYIQASSMGRAKGGAYTLEATLVEVTPAQPLVLSTPVNGTVPGALPWLGQSWTFTAPTTQRVQVRLRDWEFSPHILVRVGGPTGKVLAESIAPQVVFQAEAGTVYLIQVGMSEEPATPEEAGEELEAGQEEEEGAETVLPEDGSLLPGA